MTKNGTIVRYTDDELDEMIARGEDQTDWERVKAMTDEEVEAAVDYEEEGYPDWSQVQIGIPSPKRQLTVRLDLDIIDWFKRQGPRYQTRMNAVLKRYVEAQRKQEQATRHQLDSTGRS